MEESITIIRKESNTINQGNSEEAEESGMNIPKKGYLECPSVLPIATLPTLVKKGAELFSGQQEQLLFVYSTLVALSGIMTKVKGTYGQNTCYPNMFFMGLAPAASGKSVMMYSKSFIQPIHQHFLADSKLQLQEHRKKTRGKKNGTDKIIAGELPPYRVVQIPANCSSSKLMQHLCDNSPDTPSVMIESEIDTMVVANSSDFGNYSDILRKIFHNEPISLSRKTNNEFYDVQNPKMSLLLSGTPGQLFKLINNNEDGLFSRFLIMSFNTNQRWKDMGPCPTCINLTDFFQVQSKEYFKLWDFISKTDLEVTLLPEQWEALSIYCNEKFSEIVLRYGSNATSIIKRHGLMLFKLCMVLTGIRKYEEKNLEAAMSCRNEDFKTAHYLIDQSLYSSLEMYESLPGAKATPSNKKKDTFYKSLPDEFSRIVAITKAQELNIATRSADRYLQDFVQGELLFQPVSGKYSKEK